VNVAYGGKYMYYTIKAIVNYDKSLFWISLSRW
jgi:hypothetical protein